jgi:hypothetical protein
MLIFGNVGMSIFGNVGMPIFGHIGMPIFGMSIFGDGPAHVGLVKVDLCVSPRQGWFTEHFRQIGPRVAVVRGHVVTVHHAAALDG